MSSVRAVSPIPLPSHEEDVITPTPKRPRTTPDLPDVRLHVRTHQQLALAELTLASPLPPRHNKLILAIDRSGSMRMGTRHANALAGLRALLQLADATGAVESVVVLTFNGAPHVAFGPGTPQQALAAWGTHIEPAAKASGGTDIAAALDAALDAAQGDATVLLLTDGEDDVLTCSLDGSALAHRLSSLPAGVSLHLVGICIEADSVLLNRLATLAHGTYACIRDADIQGLMGSLLGLILEQLAWACRLNGQAVRVRAGTPTLVPLAAAPAYELRLYAPGVVPVLEAEAHTVTAAPEDRAEDYERIVLAHARAWRGAAADAVASHLAHSEPERARAALLSVADRLAEYAPLYASVQALVDEVRAEEKDVAESMDDDARLRELSARAASDASTARNSGVSIGGGDMESEGQRSMRTLSMAY